MVGIEYGNMRFIPADNSEANGEIMGRCNALYDVCMREANGKYFGSDLKMVCSIMGFNDILRKVEEKEQAEKEKASVATAD